MAKGTPEGARRPSAGGGSSGSRGYSGSSSSGTSASASTGSTPSSASKYRQSAAAKTYIEKNPSRIQQGKKLQQSQAKKLKAQKRTIGITAGAIGAATGYAIGKNSSKDVRGAARTAIAPRANRAKAMKNKMGKAGM